MLTSDITSCSINAPSHQQRGLVQSCGNYIVTGSQLWRPSHASTLIGPLVISGEMILKSKENFRKTSNWFGWCKGEQTSWFSLRIGFTRHCYVIEY
jgi:hypothetical protein